MSTQIKTAKMFGVAGIIVHQHGASAWHPAHQKHTIRVGRPDRDNDEQSHDLHDAAGGAWLGARPTAELKRRYTKCLEGVPQQPWHNLWLAKVRRPAPEAPAPAKGVDLNPESETYGFAL